MRRKDSLLNIVTGISSQIILIILGFVSRKVFVNVMGMELLGINGLFTSIISMLSLAELGIGGAIYYSLYKPIANGDYLQVQAIMKLYSKLYKFIAFAVACIGLALIPFLNIIIKVNINKSYLISIYMCFLIDTVISYVLAYKKNIISADQKGYVINAIQTGFSIILSITQIIIIVTTNNYVLYLIVKILFGLSSNIVFHIVANKLYPYLKCKTEEKLNSEIKLELIKNAKALFIVNIAAYCVSGTDNILISMFVSITAVGIYSNYLLIVGVVSGIVSQFFMGIRASYGNFLVKESLNEAHKIFNVIYFLNFWIVTFCSCCLIILLNPVILIWIGSKGLFPFIIVTIMVINFYVSSMRSAMETVRNAAGLYSPYPFFKYWALIEGILNLILGVIFAGKFKMGIIGILLATTISNHVSVLVLPWNVYKYIFKKSSKKYYMRSLLYLASAVLIIIATVFCCNVFILKNRIIVLLIKGILCVIIPNIMVILLFYKTFEFQYIWDVIKGFTKKISNKLKLGN